MLANSSPLPLPLPTQFSSPLAMLPLSQSTSGTSAAADQKNAKELAIADADAVEPTTTPLQQLHATTSASSSGLPNISRSEDEKNLNLMRQESMKDLGRLETRIGKVERDLKKAKYQKDAGKCATLRNELRQLKEKRFKLIAEIQPESPANSSSKSVSVDEASVSQAPEESIEEQLRKIKDKIRECKASMMSAENDGKEKQAANRKKKLDELQDERDRLKSKMLPPNEDEVSIDLSSKILREDYQQVLDDLQDCKNSLRHADKQGKEDEVRDLLREVKALESERDELASKLQIADARAPSSSGSVADKNFPVDANPIADVKRQLNGRLEKIAELDRLLAKLTRQGAKAEYLQEQLQEKKALKEEAGHLENLLRFLESQENADAVEETVASRSTAPSPPARTASMSRMIRTAATNRRRSSMPARPLTPVTVDGVTPLKALHDNVRNSTLLTSGALKQCFSEIALQDIEKLDAQIDTLANTIDLLYETRRRQLGEGIVAGNSKVRVQRQREIQSIDKRILKGNIKLGKLIEEREKLEVQFIPPKKLLTSKELAEEDKSFIDRFKTEKTRYLEKKHTQMLADLEHQQAWGCGTAGLQLLGGWAANATSFFIGNSVARALAPSIAGPFVSVPLSALLHVIVAGPVLKQVLDRMWNAPALAEFNNYFKLLGASWGDWARGEENKKKYASKDPEKKEKLTIAERRAEQRPFRELLWDRYKTEEAGYYAYTMNYGFKALAAAGLATVMDAGSSTYRWAEGGMHGLMAWMSGAEYVVAMQEARSRIPGAKQIVLPDRATSAAEAESLQSRLDDLQEALEDLRSRTEKDPEDPTERNLLKAIRKTQKALNAASLRSEFLGTFRYEFSAQFKTKEALADTASESIGRTISLIPTAVLGEYLKPWRTSGDFWLVFGAHALQGLLLIMPPGFTARPLYSGLVRAGIQAGINGRDKSAASRVQSSSSGRTPGDEDQGEESIIVEVSSDSDDEGWKGNPRESDEDFW